MTSNILADVAAYYSSALAKHGDTPRGVDWNGKESQLLRFHQLGKIILQPNRISVNDLGCGYGALYDHLNTQCHDLVYHGYDISSDMIRAAMHRYSGRHGARFSVAAEPQKVVDYGIASGIFNVRLGYSDAEWRVYLESVLDALDRTSRIGFAFNCLTSYSDAEKKRADLFYADPCVLFDLCMQRYSRQVALLHDYGLYEFTILVRKHQ